MALSKTGADLLRHVIVLGALNQLPPEAAKAVLNGDDTIDQHLQSHAQALHQALQAKASGKSEAPSKGAPTYKRARDLFTSADAAAPDAAPAAPSAPASAPASRQPEPNPASIHGPRARDAARRGKIRNWINEK